MSAQALNLAEIVAALEHHKRACDYPPTAILMNPYEVERLGWEDIKGVPVEPDPEQGTGTFRIMCDGQRPKSGVATSTREAVNA